MRRIIIKIDPRFPHPTLGWSLIDAENGDLLRDVALLGLVVDAANERTTAELLHIDGTLESVSVVTAVVGES